MSTWYYFECLDHTPAIKSEGEFTQHTDDSYYKRGIELAMSRPLERKDDEYDGSMTGHFETNARHFLIQHPTCNLGIIDEYGRRSSLPYERVKALSSEALILEHEISELRQELAGKEHRLGGIEAELEELNPDGKISKELPVDLQGEYNDDSGETEKEL